MQAVKRLSKRLSHRLSIGRAGETENHLVRFRGLSVKTVEAVYRNILSGVEAPTVELCVCQKDVGEGIERGSTVQVMDRKENGTLVVQSPFVPGESFTVTASEVAWKARQDWTMEDVCQFVVVPRTKGSPSGFFADAVSNRSGQVYQGSFLVCPRDSCFAEVVESMLRHFAGREFDKEYVWIDIFCMNQVFLQEKQVFTNALEQVMHPLLGNAIRKFDEHLVFLRSWFDPLPLHKLWCVYEMYLMVVSQSAPKSKDGKSLQLLLAPEEEKNFADRLVLEYATIKREISQFDARQAGCNSEVERKLLVETIEKRVGEGFRGMNRTLLQAFQQWLVEATKMTVNAKRLEESGTESLAEFLTQAGVLLHDQGQHKLAVRLYHEALFIYKEQVVLGDPKEQQLRKARIMGNLGNALADLGKLEEALEAYLEDLDISKRILGDHPEVATTINNIAVVLDDLGKHYEAIARYEASLVIRKKVLGARHPEVAETLNNIASSFFALRDLDQAEAYYEAALDIYREALGDKHASVFEALNNLATVQSTKGQKLLALETYRAALATATAAFGPNDPLVGSALVNLGCGLDDLERYDEALECFQSALVIYLERFGIKSVDVANTLNFIAGVYHAKGEDNQALGKYSEALVILREKFGEHHPTVAMTCFNMAQSFDQIGKVHDAFRASQTAYRIYSSVFGATNQDTLDALNQMKRLEDKLKRM